MAQKITENTTAAEMESIITDTIKMLSDSKLTYQEPRVRADVRARMAIARGIPEADLDVALGIGTPPPPAASKTNPATPPKKTETVKERTARLRGAASKNATYFWEKPEDSAVQEIWHRLNTEAGVHIHMMLVGPSGCGKTVGVQRFAEERGLPLTKIDCASVKTTEDWLGYMQVNEKGTYFQRSEHILALEAKERPAGIVLYDELNRLSGPQLNTLIPILDGSRRVFVPEINDWIEVNPNVLIAATANIGVGFTGTFGLDQALHDRFGIVLERNFPPREEEVKIITMRTGIEEKDALILVDMAATLRTKAVNGELAKPVSTRALLDSAALISAGMTVLQACEYTWVKKFSDEGGTSSERAAVRMVLTGKAGSR